MSMFVGRLALAIILAALALGGPAARAQVAPVPYWSPSLSFGFGGNLTAGQNFDGSDVRDGGSSSMRYNFSNGWFIGSRGGGPGLSLNGINQAAAFGNTRSLTYEGMQFGYNFKDAGGLPLAVYAGFDTLKYGGGFGGPLAPFDSMSGTLPGYRAHAGIEFQPAPNVSLSLGVGYTQQPGRIDSGTNPFAPPDASPLAFGGRR
jgi:opacity protein-like surface antigen